MLAVKIAAAVAAWRQDIATCPVRRGARPRCRPHSGSRVARIGNEVADGTIGDSQPRGNRDRRYFAHQKYYARRILIEGYVSNFPMIASKDAAQELRAIGFAPSSNSRDSTPRTVPVRRIQMSDAALHAACFSLSSACSAE
jgi:hypothetical protein